MTKLRKITKIARGIEVTYKFQFLCSESRRRKSSGDDCYAPTEVERRQCVTRSRTVTGNFQIPQIQKEEFSFRKEFVIIR